MVPRGGHRFLFSGSISWVEVQAFLFSLAGEGVIECKISTFLKMEKSTSSSVLLVFFLGGGGEIKENDVNSLKLTKMTILHEMDWQNAKSQRVIKLWKTDLLWYVDSQSMINAVTGRVATSL